MAVINTARTTTLANLMANSKALVGSKDVFDIATIGTDFSFDALNPLSYGSGALPATNDPLPSLIVAGAYVSAAGTGGTTGTFPLTISGGGGSGAAGTFKVAGGSLTEVEITNPGSGYTSAPSIIVSGASAGLSGSAIVPQMADVLNVARDVQPALARTKPIVLVPNVYASRPTFDGKGFKFVNNGTSGLTVHKVGTHPGRVCEPYFEGFLDFLEVATFRADAFPGNAMPYTVTGGGGGFAISGSLQPAAKENNVQIGGVMSVGELYTVAKRVRFNVGAGTSTMIGYMAHGGVVIPTEPIAGKATSAYATGTTGTAVIGGFNGSVATAWSGPVYHVYREFIGVSGRSDSDVSDLVQRVHERAVSRYA